MSEIRPDERAPVTLDREDAAAPTIDSDLEADDQGVGNVRPEEVTPLDPDDEGIGNVRPEQIEPIVPPDSGLGGVLPAETAPPDPADEGLGSLGTNG